MHAVKKTGDTLGAQAYAAHTRGDYKTALELYQKLAALGSDFARYEAATIQLYGYGGILPDPVKARELYEQVLGGSNLHLRQCSALTLGIIYQHGLGVSVNYDKAFSYYKRLEDSSLAVGLLRLGVLYEKGKGTKKDINKAKDIYRRATDLGNVIARKCLGSLKVRTGEPMSGYFLWGWAVLEFAFLLIFKRNSKRIRNS